MMDVLLESDKYADKALCGWYDKHAPGAGENICCVPTVRYLVLVSD